MILDGLPTEYQALTLIIHYCNYSHPMSVIEMMLLSHEDRLDRANQTPIIEPLSKNIIQDNTSALTNYDSKLPQESYSQVTRQESQ